jgi:hypothetical protein
LPLTPSADAGAGRPRFEHVPGRPKASGRASPCPTARRGRSRAGSARRRMRSRES